MALTRLEKQGFRWGALVGVFGFFACFAGFYLFEIRALAGLTMGFGFLGAIAGFLWFAQASEEALRDYGLGEGVATLYGEERARAMFGENYKRTEDD